MATYIVQVVNEPHYVVVLEVRHTTIILLPVKYLAELIMECG